MSFRNLRFSRCLFCSSVCITKRTILLLSLYVPFRIDTLTLENVGISCSFFHNFINSMSATNFSSFVFFCSKSLAALIKSCPCFFLIYLKILFQAYKSLRKSISSLIIFKKLRKITNDFFNHYIFIHTLQWTLSECLTNATITVKVAIVTYIHCENSYLNLPSEVYLETSKHLRWSFLWEKFTADAANWFHKKLHLRGLSIPTTSLYFVSWTTLMALTVLERSE